MNKKSEKDVLYFFSRSSDLKPGKGVHENVNDISKYEELIKIENWRRILSNFCKCEFEYKNHKYGSVEHAFQSAKISLKDLDLAYQFTIDSGSKLGMGIGLDARKARKIAVLDKELIEKWDKMKWEIMDEIVEARFKQDKVGAEVLLKTNDAILLHGVPRGKPMRMYSHEKAREKLLGKS
jgi:predicted NAD-dependent protein-ADP-ribosyltransferase YbiA (DUF1768 family)